MFVHLVTAWRGFCALHLVDPHYGFRTQTGQVVTGPREGQEEGAEVGTSGVGSAADVWRSPG